MPEAPFPAGYPLRGEIYTVDFNPARGSEQAGIRPAVVVSGELNNRHSPVVVVAAMSSKVSKKKYPQNVYVPAGPLPQEGVILGNQLTTIDKTRLLEYRGMLDPATIELLDRSLALNLGSCQLGT